MLALFFTCCSQVGNWGCLNTTIMLPVGVPLLTQTQGKQQSAWVRTAKTLTDCANEAQGSVQRLGYCHCDMRPDNVVFDPSSGAYDIVDWGWPTHLTSPCISTPEQGLLSRRPGGLLLRTWWPGRGWTMPAVSADTPAYDLALVRFVVLAEVAVTAALPFSGPTSWGNPWSTADTTSIVSMLIYSSNIALNTVLIYCCIHHAAVARSNNILCLWSCCYSFVCMLVIE